MAVRRIRTDVEVSSRRRPRVETGSGLTFTMCPDGRLVHRANPAEFSRLTIRFGQSRVERPTETAGFLCFQRRAR
jgi:hypothetical protein